jgi:5-methylcytosine-specific restriction enzyme subunit McrC
VHEQQIPIRNLYYLLCYAWDQLEQGQIVNVQRCPTTRLVDLFALVLCDGLKHLARRGLEQGYEVHSEELSSLRGRIDVFGSVRKFLPRRGRAVCEFDELSVNTLNNQILKATLGLLMRSQEIDSVLKKEVVVCYQGMRGIEDKDMSLSLFRRVQLHANSRFYRFLLNVCELIFSEHLVDSATGQTKFKDFERDERAMARVFERFLFNFIRRELPGTSTKRDRIGWRAESLSDPSLSLLPLMNTDISVYSGGKRLIIDAKYYRNALSPRWETEKLHSHNLYQLMSYLTNADVVQGSALTGMLIYPQVGKPLREKYVIQGIPVHIATLDLSQDWPLIHSELTGLAQWGLGRIEAAA